MTHDSVPSTSGSDKYATLVVDPPWPYESATLRKGIPYSLMPLDAIASLPVGDMALPGAHLYLWTTQRFLWDAKRIAEGWGWDVLQVLTWCKAEGFGFGPKEAFANNTEFVLYCRRPVGRLIKAAREARGLSQYEVEREVRGEAATRLISRWELEDCYPSVDQWDALATLLDLPKPLAGEPTRQQTTWWRWNRSAHSRKPEAFLDMVEGASPGPYLELFARRNRLGWATWGDEAMNHVEIPA